MKSERIMSGPKRTVTPRWPVLLHDPDDKVGYDLTLICRECGGRRLVAAGPDGGFPPGFWLCPRGCGR